MSGRLCGMCLKFFWGAIMIDGLPADIEKQLAEALRIAGEYREDHLFYGDCDFDPRDDCRCGICSAYDAMVAKNRQEDASPDWVWQCNSCGSIEYNSTVSEADVHRMACARCGANEFHKAQPAHREAAK